MGKVFVIGFSAWSEIYYHGDIELSRKIAKRSCGHTDKLMVFEASGGDVRWIRNKLIAHFGGKKRFREVNVSGLG